jgi:diguanylate cyclase (GGDEF)-like protein
MKKLAKRDALSAYLKKINKHSEEFIQVTLKYDEIDNEQDVNIVPIENSQKNAQCWKFLKCEDHNCPAYHSDDYRCWLIAGTLCGGEVQGVFAHKHISCYSCKVFRQYTSSAASSLYENIGIIIKQLGDKKKQIRELAIKDSLTGLYNRNYLNIVENREIENAKREKTPISIILFDLNKFKLVNDTYGHLQGDELLKEFSEFLKEFSRESDLLFRYGGDEFLLLMNNADDKECKYIERRFIDSIKKWSSESKREVQIPLSFSMGGATSFESHNLNELIDMADLKMYEDKKG